MRRALNVSGWMATVVGALALLVASGCGGPSYQAKLSDYTIESTDFPLPSGLRVVFQEDRARPTVTVVTVVDAGMTSDPAGREGLAHLVEHLCFRAKPDGKTQVMDVIKGFGGSFNAYTASERTVYLTTAPKDALPGLLRIEALRMMDPLVGVTDDVIKIEREVVRNELRVRTETRIINKVFESLQAALYPKGHPFHRTGIGTHDTLSAITMDDARAFVKAHYVPKKVTIVVSGDFDRKQAGAMLQAAFPTALVTADGKAPPPGQTLSLATPEPRISGPAPALPPPPATPYQEMTGAVPETTVFIGWALPAGFRGDAVVLEAASQLLSAWLGFELRPRSQGTVSRTTGLGCGHDESVAGTVMWCAIGVAPGESPDAIVEAARGGPSRLWQTGGSAGRAMFDRARVRMLNGILSELAGPQRVERVALHTHYRGTTDAYAKAFAALSETTADTLRDFAFEYLTRDRMATLVVRPEKQNKKDGPAFDSTAAWPGAVFEADPRLDAIYAKLGPAQIEQAAVAPPIESATRIDLPGGSKAIIVQQPGAPLVRLTLFAHSGYQSTDPVGMDQFAMSNSDERPPYRFGGRWTGGAGTDSRTMGIEAPAANLPDALDALLTRVKTSRASGLGMQHEKMVRFAARLEKQRLENDEAFAVQAAIDATLFEGHPLAQMTMNVPAMLALEDADFKAHMRKWLAPANVTLMVVGDLDPARTKALIEATWKGWRVGDAGAKLAGLPAPPAAPEKARVVFRARPDASQSQLTIACRLDASPAGDASRAVLGEALRADLWRSLRENTGSSYSPFAFVRQYAGGTAVLEVRATVQTDQTMPALNGIIGRIGALANGELSDASLRSAQWAIARSTRMRNGTPGALTGTLANAERLGLDTDALMQFPKRLAAVDAGAVGGLLSQCAGREVIGVVGPPSLAEALGALGPVQTVE